MDKRKAALEAYIKLGNARDFMMLCYHSGTDHAVDFNYKHGMEHLYRALPFLGISDATIAPPTTLHNPHHSGYLADDEKHATSCPHCGNEDGYDSERRCQACGLFDLDDADAKRFRLADMIKGMDDEQLNQLFSQAVEVCE